MSKVRPVELRRCELSRYECLIFLSPSFSFCYLNDVQAVQVHLVQSPTEESDDVRSHAQDSHVVIQWSRKSVVFGRYNRDTGGVSPERRPVLMDPLKPGDSSNYVEIHLDHLAETINAYFDDRYLGSMNAGADKGSAELRLVVIGGAAFFEGLLLAELIPPN